MREAQFADMIAHGLRTIVLYCFDGAPEVSFTDGEAHFDYARVDETLAMLKRYGFLGPIPVYAPHARIKHALPEDVTLDDDLGRQALGAMVRGMIRKYAEYGFEVQFYPYDEPSASGPSFEAAQNLLKLYKAAAPEARTFCTAVLASATNLDEWLDTRCYCGLKDGWFEAAAKAGDEVWEYGGVYGSAANSSLRLKAGLANVRTGVRGKLYWVYCWPKGSAWFDLDNSGKETGAVVPSPDGPIPIVAYECLREGIDDARYFETLRVLAEARDSAPARTLLDEVMAKFNDIGHLQDEKTSLTELRETMARQIAVLSAP